MHAVRAQHGFTLIETLVALVVISIGLLGLFGLQTMAIVDTSGSQAQTLASIAANDLADRIRVNPTVDYAAVTVSKTATKAPTQCDAGHYCSAQQMAAFDLWEWHDGLASRLPAGEGELECRLAGDISKKQNPCLVYKIAVQWHRKDVEEDAEINADEDACGAGKSRGCYVLEVRP